MNYKVIKMTQCANEFPYSKVWKHHFFAIWKLGFLIEENRKNTMYSYLTILSWHNLTSIVSPNLEYCMYTENEIRRKSV